MECSIYEGKTRWEILFEKQHPGNNRPIPYRSILLTLGYKTKSSVSMAGQGRFRGSIFLLADSGELATGDKLIGYMQVLAGKNIDIYWLDGNDGECLAAIVCLRDTTRVICEVVEQPVTARSKIGETKEQARNRELFARYRATLEGYSQRRYHGIEKVTVLDHREMTLNKKFRIPGVKRYEAVEEVEEVEVLDTVGVETSFESDSNDVQKSFAPSLNDRF